MWFHFRPYHPSYSLLVASWSRSNRLSGAYRSAKISSSGHFSGNKLIQEMNCLVFFLLLLYLISINESDWVKYHMEVIFILSTGQKSIVVGNGISTHDRRTLNGRVLYFDVSRQKMSQHVIAGSCHLAVFGKIDQRPIFFFLKFLKCGLLSSERCQIFIIYKLWHLGYTC